MAVIGLDNGVHFTLSVVKVGDKAPVFRIKVDDGSETGLDDLRGKVVLVNFFATWCGPCMGEMPHLQTIWDANQGTQDFTMLVIGREETDEAVAAFKKKHGYSFPIAADPKRSVYSLYAHELIPRTFLISRDGTICFAGGGFNEDELDKLKKELATQLRGTR